MKSEEDKTNENKKSYINLLKKVNSSGFKFRDIGGGADIFFPSKDIFVYLNRMESFFFKNLFIEKTNLKKVVTQAGSKFKLCEKTMNNKIIEFLDGLLESIK